jgi:hypothetical protein
MENLTGRPPGPDKKRTGKGQKPVKKRSEKGKKAVKKWSKKRTIQAAMGMEKVGLEFGGGRECVV